MSNKDEALKLALEWLEYIDQQDNDRDFLGPEECCALDDTRNTIREALAEQPAQQEPVAVHQFRKRGCSDWYDGYPDHTDGGGPYESRTLYTSPQSKPWVGLTEQDWMAIDETARKTFQRHKSSIRGQAITPEDSFDMHLIWATEAKLREKNT